MFSHVQWSYRLLSSADHEYVRRAHEAVEWVIDRAARSTSVLVVTHGGFRRILDDRLVSRGWRRRTTKRSYQNWSTWSYSAPPN
jgi:broad specificity phosphatase PhoE